jgi:hypothetical protein
MTSRIAEIRLGISVGRIEGPGAFPRKNCRSEMAKLELRIAEVVQKPRGYFPCSVFLKCLGRGCVITNLVLAASEIEQVSIVSKSRCVRESE